MQRLRMRPRQRQGDIKGAALADLTLNPHPAPMQLHEPLAQR